MVMVGRLVRFGVCGIGWLVIVVWNLVIWFSVWYRVVMCGWVVVDVVYWLILICCMVWV